MDKRRKSLKKSPTGRYVRSTVTGEVCQAYIPHPLPPDVPMEDFATLLDKANVSLGRLDGIGRLDGMRTTLPDSSQFIEMYACQEAVQSSKIEGTQSSMSDLLLFEKSGKPSVGDEAEVSRYVSAMKYALKEVKKPKGLPLSLGLIKGIHGVLMEGAGRGGNTGVGEFRTSQNWIGGTRPGNALFIPPPPEELMPCLECLEKFLHSKELPVLIKVALAHVQFETIHPFLDGNGRVGRLLITLILCVDGILTEPLLYLSLYFKENQDKYYSCLQAVQEKGAWEDWIQFFLEGVIEVSEQAIETAKCIGLLFKCDFDKIKEARKDTKGVLWTYDYLKRNPIIKPSKIKERSKPSLPTVMRSLRTLESLGLIKEKEKNKYRHKIFEYESYLQLLDTGVKSERLRLSLLGEADVHAKDKDGTTLLHRAADGGYKEEVEALVNKGASVNAKDKYGVTPLYLADLWGHKEVVAYLKSKGAK